MSWPAYSNTSLAAAISGLHWVDLTAAQAVAWGGQQPHGWPPPLADTPLGSLPSPGQSDPAELGVDPNDPVLSQAGQVLAAPDHALYVIRHTETEPTHYAAYLTSERAMLVVYDTAVRISVLPRELAAVALSSQVPLPEATGPSVELTAQDLARLAAAAERGPSGRGVSADLDHAGIPAEYQAILANPDRMSAQGSITALAFRPTRTSTQTAAWIEAGRDAVIWRPGRHRQMIVEPATERSLAQALTTALTALY